MVTLKGSLSVRNLIPGMKCSQTGKPLLRNETPQLDMNTPRKKNKKTKERKNKRREEGERKGEERTSRIRE